MTATEHDRASQLLGAWALDACTATEHALVDAHRGRCQECAAEAEILLHSVLDLGARMRPPADLRGTVLRAARTVRRAPAVVVAEPYAAEVCKLDRLLATCTAGHFGLRQAVPPPQPHPVDGFRARTEAAQAWAREQDPALVRDAWRGQAGALTRHMVGSDAPPGAARIDYGGSSWPLDLVLLARAFETWIHADDVRGVLGVPLDPPVPGHLFLFTRALMQLLPGALTATGIDQPGGYVRFALTGDGGGDWDLPLGSGLARAQPVAAVTMDVLDFCYLVGGRRDLDLVEHRISGDTRVAAGVLAVAAAFDRD